ncbi:class F sortase [Xylanimonas ulmi]
MALLALGVLLVAGGIGGVIRHAGQTGAHDHLPRDLAGQPVRLEEGTEPTDDQVVRMRAVDDDGARFQAASVGLDVPLGSLTEVDAQIVPPGFTTAYRVRNRGVDVEHAAEGTVYVVMHSLRGRGTAPGDYLADRETGASRLTPGDPLRVVDGGRAVEYTVTSAELVDKDALPATAQVWTDEPGRLVVITCMQRAGGEPSLQNLVVYATLR